MGFIEGLAYFALFYVFAIGLLTSGAHMVLSGVRVLRDKPSGLNRLIAARWIVVLLSLVWIGILFGIYFLVKKTGINLSVGAYIAAGLMYLGLLPLIVLPVVLPLFEVWREHRTSSMTLAVASTVAFPVIVAFVLSLSYNYLMTLPGSAELRLTHGVPVAGIRPDVPHDSDLYAMRFPDHEASPLVERMSHAMTRFLGLPELKPGSQEATNVDPRIYEQHRDALWLEMSLNVISFESLDRFHLTLSSLKFNSPSLIVPLVQFLFGIFYPLLFWGVVLLLGRSVLRFTRRRFSGSAA